MKWKYENYSKWLKCAGEWHKWFAWYPCWDSEHRFWLITVERRWVSYSLFYHNWEYREVVK